MKEFLLLDIVTPEGMVFSGEVKSVQLPGITGEMGVLPGHASLLTGLKDKSEGGVVEIVDKDGKKQLVLVNDGSYRRKNYYPSHSSRSYRRR